MSEEIMIDPNEELDCYIGMDINEVENDLCDKEIEYRTRAEGVVYRDTAEFKTNRVNLVVGKTAYVLWAYYG